MTTTEEWTPEAITLPDDEGKSRIRRSAPEHEVDDDEIVRYVDRLKSFKRKHPDGRIDTQLVQVIEHPDGDLTYVVRASVWAWPSVGDEDADATAFAQGSTKSPNPVVAASPLESADTIARSRALRNLGILPNPTRKKRQDQK